MLTLLGCTTGGEDWIDIHRRSAIGARHHFWSIRHLDMLPFELERSAVRDPLHTVASPWSHNLVWLVGLTSRTYRVLGPLCASRVSHHAWTGLVSETGSIPAGMLVFFIATFLHSRRS